ncbi:13515_t:CDS:2 [Acaulospora colombiana]|uniref:13515_t:CDS:1 n=1 Tax=Acaulospora colombiana TaxID=27376 RepID=A0ACA9PHA1_9GLOM|nr:13515_t:CDS:2 [Acaulospora colombiana]
MEVGDLKKLIWNENTNVLAGIDAAELILYRVDASALNPQDRIKEAKTKMESLRFENALDAGTALSKLYPSNPPEDTIHIFVEPPTKGVKRKASAEANY